MNTWKETPCHYRFPAGSFAIHISGITCGSGSFPVPFGDHFRSGDHLQSGIICGAVQQHVHENYLSNRVFLSRNYRLIVAPLKFDVLKTNICPRSEASRANMLVLRTSNFQGAAPIVSRHKHSIVLTVHH